MCLKFVDIVTYRRRSEMFVISIPNNDDLVYQR